MLRAVSIARLRYHRGMGLPFLLEYGAWAWKVSLVVIGGGAGWAWWALRRRAPLRRLGRVVGELERTRDCDVVRGRLGGGVLESLVAVRPTPLESGAADRRPTKAWIETAEGKVALDGTVRVLAGTTTLHAYQQIPLGTPEPIADEVPAGTLQSVIAEATYAAVAAGDEVVACGRLERVAGDQVADYRADAGAQVLRGLDDAPIRLAARTPRSPRKSTRLGVAFVAVVAVLGAAKIENALGKHWNRACDDLGVRDDDPGAPALSSGDACVLAAAMPGTRTDALDSLRDRLDGHRAGGRAAFETRVAVARLSGCAAELRLLDDAGAYDQLLAEARRCGDRRWEHLALVELGRFDEAAKLVVPAEARPHRISLAALPTADTLVLAGRWAEAAAAVDRIADRLTSADAKQRGEALEDRCVAELLRSYAGDGGALARLRALAAAPDGGACALVLAAAAPPDERATQLARTDIPDDRGLERSAMRWMASDAWITRPEEVLTQPDDDAMGYRLFPVWDAEDLPDDQAADPAVRARVEEWRAVAAVFAGDLAAARVHATAAQQADKPGADDVDGEFIAELPAVIELYTTGASAPVAPPSDSEERELWVHTYGGLLLRRGGDTKGAYFGPDDNYVAALRRAEAGDGTQLASLMLLHRTTWWRTADLMAVLPRVKTGHAALVDALVWAKPFESIDTDIGFPWRFAAYAAMRRAALEVAGEHTEAARWGAIYQRYDAALRDRRKLVPLLLLARDW